MVKSIRVAGGLIGALALLPSAQTHAQDLAHDMVRCGDVSNDAARLRCFDALMPTARKSEAERRAEAEAKTKAEFGLTAVQRNEKVKQEKPEMDRPQRPAPEENLRIEAAISRVDINQYNTVFMLDNGQIWQTTSFGSLSTVPRMGQKVLVRSGPLGGYRLTMEGQSREIGVKRLK